MPDLTIGKDPMFWYRLEVSLGRNSVVGTTVRRREIPEHLLADEHHRKRDGNDEINTGPGVGGGPDVRTFETDPLGLVDGFFAMEALATEDSSFFGGLFVG